MKSRMKYWLFMGLFVGCYIGVVAAVAIYSTKVCP